MARLRRQALQDPPDNPGDLSSWAQSEISLTKDVVHHEERQARDLRLKLWKQDMNQGSLSKLSS